MTRRRRELGRIGEELAAAYLESAGFRIRERNVRLRGGEIDIVAHDGPVLVFVEVRTRRGGELGGPLESVDRRKQRKLLFLARAYLQSRGLGDAPCRFDVVGISWPRAESPPVIEHVRDAFGAC